MDDGKNDSELRRKEHFLKRILPCFPPGRRRQPPKSTTMNGKVAPQQDVSINLFVTSKKRNHEFSNSPIHEFKVLQNVSKMKKQGLKCFLKY